MYLSTSYPSSVSLTLALVLLVVSPLYALAQETSQPNKLARYLQHEDTAFAAYVNEKTGTPYWVIDVDALDFNLGQAPALQTENQVKNATLAFLAAHAEAFNFSPDLLGEPRITTDGDLWFVSFPQRHAGLPVLGAGVGLTVNHAGHLVALGVNGFPNIKMSTVPSLAATTAAQTARLQTSRLSAEVANSPTLVVVPVEQENRYTYRLAWQFRLDDLTSEDPFSKTFVVDARTGDVLSEIDNVLHYAAHGMHGQPEVRKDMVAATTPAPYARPHDTTIFKEVAELNDYGLEVHRLDSN